MKKTARRTVQRTTQTTAQRTIPRTVPETVQGQTVPTAEILLAARTARRIQVKILQILMTVPSRDFTVM